MPSVIRLLLFTVISFSLETVESAGGKNLPDIRLPKSIVPEHYEIGIIPDIQGRNEIEGFVHLDFFVQSSTDQLVMHGVNLTVIEESIVISAPALRSMELMQENDVSKTNSNGINEKVKQLTVLHPVVYDVDREFIIIRLGSKLEENFRYRISLNYTGVLAKNLKGFYRSDYLDMKTQSKK